MYKYTQKEYLDKFAKPYGSFEFYPYGNVATVNKDPVPFAYSLALVDFNEDECGEFYTYLDFWVVKNLEELKKTLKRRGVTADSNNYQIKVFYTDGSWDFFSLKDALS